MDDRRDDDLTRRALGAATEIGREQGLPVADLEILSDRGNLLARFTPAPVVARVATRTAWTRSDPYAWLAREISVARFAAANGGPVVQPATSVDPGPHVKVGLAVSLWAYVRTSADVADGTAVGRALAGLHQSLAAYDGNLPTMVVLEDQITDGLTALRRVHAIDEDDAREIERRQRTILDKLDARTDPHRVLHGDAHRGNLLATDQGWRWIDLEETCTGPRGWDLAVMTSHVDAAEAMRAYARTIGETPQEDLAIFHEGRALEALVWVLGMAHQYPERYRATADDMLTTFRAGG